MATTKTAKTKKLSNLREGEGFVHTTRRGKKLNVKAVAPQEKLAARGKLANKNGVVVKAKVKSGPNAGKDRLIVQYQFQNGAVAYRYADLDEKVTLV